MIKRIIFITHYFHENIVGTFRIKHLMEVLPQHGYEVTVIVGSAYKEKKDFLSAIYEVMKQSVDEKYYISCGPFYYLFPILKWAFWLKKKVIIDYRDPWFLNLPDTKIIIKGTSVRAIYYKLRILFIEWFSHIAAEKIIVCTPGMFKYYKNLFLSKKKLLLIMNGFNFDIEEGLQKKNVMSGIEEYICMGKFIYYSRGKAIKTLRTIEERVLNKGIIANVTFIGSETDDIMEIIEEMEISPKINFSFHDRLPYDEVMILVRKSDIGFLIIRNEDIDFGTKVFDFIGFGIPILNTFNKQKIFYRTFKKYLIDVNDDYSKNMPDIAFHRNSIWNKNLDIFK